MLVTSQLVLLGVVTGSGMGVVVMSPLGEVVVMGGVLAPAPEVFDPPSVGVLLPAPDVFDPPSVGTTPEVFDPPSVGVAVPAPDVFAPPSVKVAVPPGAVAVPPGRVWVPPTGGEVAPPVGGASAPVPPVVPPPGGESPVPVEPPVGNGSPAAVVPPPGGVAPPPPVVPPPVGVPSPPVGPPSVGPPPAVVLPSCLRCRKKSVTGLVAALAKRSRALTDHGESAHVCLEDRTGVLGNRGGRIERTGFQTLKESDREATSKSESQRRDRQPK